MASIDDWAAKAVDYIHSTYLSSPRPTRERTAAVIETFAKPLLDLVMESRREHEHGLHGVRCCPQCCCESWPDDPEGDFEPTPNSDDPCSCGADAWNAKVDAALGGRLQRPRQAAGTAVPPASGGRDGSG